VVLPLENLSPDPDNAFFADGLTEEIISDLSRVKALRVISRTTAMRYKGTGKDVPTIARELGVRYVLEGTVRRAGNALRVTAQLIDAPSDTHLWAEKYGGTLEDVFAIQEKLAREIVSALQVTLTPAEARRVRRVIDNPEAYDCYLRARQLVMLSEEGPLQAARQQLERARELVGDHPLVLAALAYLSFQLVETGVDAAPENNDRALALAGRAVAADPECAEAHTVIGAVHRARGQVADSNRALRRALDLDPNNAEALGWLVLVLSEGGRSVEAAQLGERLARVSPFEPVAIYAIAMAHIYDGRIAEASMLLEQWQGREQHPYSWFVGAMIHLVTGDHERLAEWCAASLRAMANPFMVQLEAVTRRVLQHEQPLVAGWPPEQASSWHNDKMLCWILASLLAANGEQEDAVTWLRRAAELGLIHPGLLLRHSVSLRALAGFPPYDALMEEVRLRAAQLGQ
jgi:TolB-like protein/Flp pilus assembly protein TadD